MLTKTDVANLALGHLGVSLGITDLALDNSTQAKIIRRHLRMSLDTILEAHPWNFATQFQLLTVFAEDPGAGFRYSYNKPSDALVVRQLSPDGYFTHANLYEEEKVKWREIYVGGVNYLWCNLPKAYAEYTTRVPENNQFPTHFARAFAAQLAMDIAPSLITNNYPKVKASLGMDAKKIIDLAISDDMGRQPTAEDSPSPFLSCRM